MTSADSKYCYKFKVYTAAMQVSLSLFCSSRIYCFKDEDHDLWIHTDGTANPFVNSMGTASSPQHGVLSQFLDTLWQAVVPILWWAQGSPGYYGVDTWPHSPRSSDWVSICWDRSIPYSQNPYLKKSSWVILKQTVCELAQEILYTRDKQTKTSNFSYPDKWRT